MERPQRPAFGRLPVGLVRQRQALGVREFCDNRVQRRVQPLDLAQVRGHHVAGRQRPRLDQRGELARAHEADVGRRGGHQGRIVNQFAFTGRGEMEARAPSGWLRAG